MERTFSSRIAQFLASVGLSVLMIAAWKGLDLDGGSVAAFFIGVSAWFIVREICREWR